MMKELKCHVGIGPEVKGFALVADDNFSARYDLDRINGVFSRPQHKLYGESYKDVILVLNTAKGGVATAWMLYEMASENAPKLFYLYAIHISSGAALARWRWLIDLKTVMSQSW